MVLETGRPIAEVARDLGIHDGTLGNWVNAWRQANPEPDRPSSPVDRARVAELEDEVRRLRLENEFLKSRGLLRQDAPVAERCAVIDAEKPTYPIAWMCRLLRVPRSSFYAWRSQAAAETATAARRRELAGHVARVFAAGRGAYGCRRVAAQLNREGHRCSVGLVADLMRELGLKACQPRAYRRTTVPGEDPVSSPDLIGRDFTAEQPGTRLVGDITYLKTGEGWLYLATVIDLATRMVVGWQLAEHMRTSLVVDALDMAVVHGHVRPGAVFHSDRGAIHLSHLRRVLRQPPRPNEPGPHRGVLGQRRRRIVLRRPEERVLPPAIVPDPGPCPVRRRRLHRDVLQPTTAALQPRLPHPGRGTCGIPRTESSLINNPKPCPRSLTQLTGGYPVGSGLGVRVMVLAVPVSAASSTGRAADS
jgi:putative transposase